MGTISAADFERYQAVMAQVRSFEVGQDVDQSVLQNMAEMLGPNLSLVVSGSSRADLRGRFGLKA